MKLPKFLWIKGQKYYYHSTYDDCDYQELKKYLERQRKRNGTRYYLMNFDIFTIFPESKIAVYLNKTITLDKNNRTYNKHPQDNRWKNTNWGNKDDD